MQDVYLEYFCTWTTFTEYFIHPCSSDQNKHGCSTGFLCPPVIGQESRRGSNRQKQMKRGRKLLVRSKLKRSEAAVCSQGLRLCQMETFYIPFPPEICSQETFEGSRGFFLILTFCRDHSASQTKYLVSKMSPLTFTLHRHIKHSDE